MSEDFDLDQFEADPWDQQGQYDSNDPLWNGVGVSGKSLSAAPASAASLSGAELPDYTNTTMANLFLGEHGDDVRHVTDSGSWLTWDGRRWTYNEKAVDRKFQQTVANLEQRMHSAFRSELDSADGKEAKASVRKKWGYHLQQCQRYKNTSAIKAALERAAKHESIEVLAAQLDQKTMVLNCANGTVDLELGTMRPHDRADLLTIVLETEFDPDAECPLWIKSLYRWLSNDPEYARYVWKAFGYTLTGSTKEECLFFPYGKGRNGKSTALKVIQRILGGYAVTAPNNLLNAGIDGVKPHDTATLQGCRMAVAPEVDGSKHFVAADLKRLASRDKLSAKRLYEQPYNFFPTHKLWLTGNDLPTVRNDDEGTWRRMRILPFTERITDAELDQDLDEKLFAEAKGILAWLVRGCLKWQEEGLVSPKKVLEATGEYRARMDLLGAFIDDVSEVDLGGKIATGDLYKVYKQWCQYGGQKAVVNQRGLAQKLMERGWESKKISTNHWVGRRLRDDLPSHLDPRLGF